MGDGYALVICEKPDAARRVSEALSGGAASSSLVQGVPAFRFSWQGEEFVVCAAQGHVYAVSDPFAERSVYPVFDVEWYGNDIVEKEAEAAARRISAIRNLARGAGRFVNACDYDVEGETIGYNILRYACGGKERDAYRARFSTLTKDELNEAFGAMSRPLHHGMADAGRARHLIDFVWGVNLSRVLSQSVLGSGRGYRTISVGRVQGPTLDFVVEREREIRAVSEIQAPIRARQISGKVLALIGGRAVAQTDLVTAKPVGQAWTASVAAGVAPWGGWSMILAAIILVPRYARTVAKGALRRRRCLTPRCGAADRRRQS